MPNLAKGVVVRGEIKKFGYIAKFKGGAWRRHETIYPKSHCVRVQLAKWQRWQSDPFAVGLPERVDERGFRMFLYTFDYYKNHYVYEWFSDEHSACRRVKQCLAMTQMHHHMGIENSNLNAEFYGLPYYAAVEIAPATPIYADPETIDDLAALGDPRLVVTADSLEGWIPTLDRPEVPK